MPRPVGSKNKQYITLTDQKGSKCHRGCPALPVGSPRSHCTVCHNTFDGPTKFDNHRFEGRCQDPASLGWELRNGFWSTSEGHDKFERQLETLARARASRGQGPADPFPLS